MTGYSAAEPEGGRQRCIDVVLLTLGDDAAATARAPRPGAAPAPTRCARPARGSRLVTAGSDAEIDAGARRPADGRPTGPADRRRRGTDGQLRAVVRRLVRRYAPPPSQRPADLPADRTVPDLPPSACCRSTRPAPDLAAQLGPAPRPGRGGRGGARRPASRRLDLLRNDGGSVTLDGALLGGADDAAGRCRGGPGSRSTTPCSPTAREPLLACAVANAGGYPTSTACRC